MRAHSATNGITIKRRGKVIREPLDEESGGKFPECGQEIRLRQEGNELMRNARAVPMCESGKDWR